VRRPVVFASVIVFIASFCTLVIELVAGRVLAPYVGVSLYTWTSIIGVVLAGISGGAWAGGWVADRRPAASTLAWLLLASGFAAMVIAPATSLLAADDGLLANLGLATTLLQRVVVLSLLLFFLPAFLLGMISPVAVKLAVRELDTAGSVVGRIYAISTLGSIAGTFVTGFWLVARFGTRATLIGVGVALIVTALLAGLFGRIGRAAGALAIAMALAYTFVGPGALPPPEQNALFAPRDNGVVHEEESQYYTIRVERTIRPDTGGAMHALHLDHLVHSYADLDDPDHLEYGYLRIFNDVAGAAMERTERPRYLFIGGGGYTLPRLLSRYHADVEVVEIDPAVTRVARRYFGVSRQLPIRTFNEDARAFAMREHDAYDVIFIDAFNDLSVPYHLTTREFTQSLARLLRPGGAIVANLVDHYDQGRFLVSYAKTLESVFGTGNLSIVLEGEEDLRSTRSTFVLVASKTHHDFPDWYVLPQPELRRAVGRASAIVLTDDYAPVDNMLASLFEERFVDETEE
jgi:predicted membrane-bound spermidine synthase